MVGKKKRRGGEGDPAKDGHERKQKKMKEEEEEERDEDEGEEDDGALGQARVLLAEAMMMVEEEGGGEEEEEERTVKVVEALQRCVGLLEGQEEEESHQLSGLAFAMLANIRESLTSDSLTDSGKEALSPLLAKSQIELYQQALQHDPSSVTAHLALGRLLRPLVQAQDDIKAVEKHLRVAVGGEGEEQKEARDRLGFLLGQEGRWEEADDVLSEGGYRYRLGFQVLAYPLKAGGEGSKENRRDGGTPSASDSPAFRRRFFRVVDEALPAPVVSHLAKEVFGPGRPFWTDHGYNHPQRDPGYFSYLYPLHQPPSSSIEQVIQLLWSHGKRLYPDLAHKATCAEWWAHCRDHTSGHQLHFDSENEGVGIGGQVRHPLFSAVVYLSEGVGGPTLVTDQVLGGPLARHGWLVYPRYNRLALFDARHLHGVIPGRGLPPKGGDPRRISFMVGFWDRIKALGDPSGQPGPSRLLPNPALDESSGSGEGDGSSSKSNTNGGGARLSWLDTIRPLPPSSLEPPGKEGEEEDWPDGVMMLPVDGVWERVGGGGSYSGDGGDKEALPHYETCFQGF